MQLTQIPLAFPKLAGQSRADARAGDLRAGANEEAGGDQQDGGGRHP